MIWLIGIAVLLAAFVGFTLYRGESGRTGLIAALALGGLATLMLSPILAELTTSVSEMSARLSAAVPPME